LQSRGETSSIFENASTAAEEFSSSLPSRDAESSVGRRRWTDVSSLSSTGRPPSRAADRGADGGGNSTVSTVLIVSTSMVAFSGTESKLGRKEHLLRQVKSLTGSSAVGTRPPFDVQKDVKGGCLPLELRRGGGVHSTVLVLLCEYPATDLAVGLGKFSRRSSIVASAVRGLRCGLGDDWATVLSMGRLLHPAGLGGRPATAEGGEGLLARSMEGTDDVPAAS
jgi:hypothetical protein